MAIGLGTMGFAAFVISRKDERSVVLVLRFALTGVLIVITLVMGAAFLVSVRERPPFPSLAQNPDTSTSTHPRSARPAGASPGPRTTAGSRFGSPRAA